MAQQRDILPYGWRKKVAETLAAQGLQLNSQQIADVLRGRSSDLATYKKVVAAKQKVARQHRLLLQRTGKLAALFLVSLWLI